MATLIVDLNKSGSQVRPGYFISSERGMDQQNSEFFENRNCQDLDSATLLALTATKNGCFQRGAHYHRRRVASMM